MRNAKSLDKGSAGRRSFLRNGMLAGGAAIGAGVLSGATKAFSQEYSGGSLTKGDIAILRFVAAAELLETDLWIQYAELGGVTPGQPPVEDTPNFTPMNSYQAAFMNLDGDGPQYVTSNTLDEMSHATFINAYLESKGADPVDLDKFRNLKGSQATGAKDIGRLTNLMQLNVDTSWYIRYRSETNPDFGATFPQAIKINSRTAIPRNDVDFEGEDHIQAIADTAAFHFGSIEQGGSSLYAALSQKVSSAEVLRITLGIGGDEIAHFFEWGDFAGNAVQGPPFDFNNQQSPVTDNGLTFPNFNNPPNPLLQTNLIFPVPCEFISPQLPKCAVIRPPSDQFGGAMAAVESLTGSGLFTGQSGQFLATLSALATAADSARRERY